MQDTGNTKHEVLPLIGSLVARLLLALMILGLVAGVVVLVSKTYDMTRTPIVQEPDHNLIKQQLITEIDKLIGELEATQEDLQGAPIAMRVDRKYEYDISKSASTSVQYRAWLHLNVMTKKGNAVTVATHAYIFAYDKDGWIIESSEVPAP